MGKTSYEMCRIFGHAWCATKALVARNRKSVTQSMCCGNCGTEKQFTLDAKGVVTKSKYFYPDGYASPGTDPQEYKRKLRVNYYGLG